jgi:hypothetical protein
MAVTASISSITGGLLESSAGGASAFEFHVTLHMDATSNVDREFVVGGSVSGTATPGEDHGGGTTTATVTVPANSLSSNPGSVYVPFENAAYNDKRPEGEEKIVVTVEGYTSGGTTSSLATKPTAEAFIGDDEVSSEQPTPPVFVCATPAKSGDDDDGTSDYPVRYFDGSPEIFGTDLTAPGFGTMFGQRRSFNTPQAIARTSPGPNGYGWVSSERPFLIQSGSSVAVVDSGLNQRWFDFNGSTYTARFGVLDKLTTATGEFVLTNSDGSVVKFYNFDMSLPLARRGTFKSVTDAAGNTTSVHSVNGDGKPTDVRRSGGGVTESLLYAYVASGANAGLVESVTLRRGAPTGGVRGRPPSAPSSTRTTTARLPAPTRSAGPTTCGPRRSRTARARRSRR